MKKLFLLLFTVCCVLTACSDGEGNEPKEIVLGEGTQTTQTVYADDTANKGEGIKFTTTGPWTAEVSEVATRAAGSTVEWLKLNQYSGDKAGDYTLTLTLTENLTGSDRKATIKIICGSTTITITVEQKGKKEDGSEPDEPVVPSVNKLIAKIRYTREFDAHGSGTTRATEYSFTYDAQNRVVKIAEMDYDKDGKGELDNEITWTYSGNTITQTEKNEEEDGYSYENNMVYVLSNDMKVTSWSSEEKETQNGAIRGQWKEKGTHHYNEDGYLTSVDITSESDHGSGWETSSSTDFCEWENGNLIKTGQRECAKCVASMTYGNVDNTGNLDLNFLLANTEWIDCLAFGETGVKLFGYIGKRSAKLMTKETDHFNNYYSTYDYTLNNDGTVATVKMIGYTDDGTVEFRRNYTLTYMDAN